jgi:hypothetical protein
MTTGKKRYLEIALAMKKPVEQPNTTRISPISKHTTK